MAGLFRQIWRTLVPFLLVACAWELISRFSSVNSGLFPPPIQVCKALFDLLGSGLLLSDVLWSLRRAVFGLLLGGTLGLVVGTLTGRIRLLNWLLVPVFNGFRSLPPVAIVPLVVVWAGLGEQAKILITSWAAFFPVWLNTHAGVSSVDKLLIWIARSLGAKKARLQFTVSLPAALPQILVGFRLAISTTLMCVVVAEMTGAYTGIGYRLYSAYLVFRVDRMIAYMVVLSVIGIASDRMFNICMSRLFPWMSLAHESQ